MNTITTKSAWQALKQHHVDIGDMHLRQFFVENSQREKRWDLDATGLYLDDAKILINAKPVAYLAALAHD